MSHFAKRHYEALAQAMQSARQDILVKEPEGDQQALLDGVAYAVDWMADTFRRDNPRFDLDRFKRACVPGANVRARRVIVSTLRHAETDQVLPVRVLPDGTLAVGRGGQ